MAGFPIAFILSLIVTLSLTFLANGKPPTFLKSISLSPFKLEMEKLSHFQFYWHEILADSNPTAIIIVNPPAVNSSIFPGFGSIIVIDSPITEKPEIGSKLLGRAQGFNEVASKEELALLTMMNFVFTTGRYNGSTLTVLGRNPINQKVREMPVVGGSGLFRFAKGYVQARIYSYNNKTGYTIVTYDVYVIHY